MNFMALGNISDDFGGLLQLKSIQAWIAHLVAHRLGTREVQGSNPDKGDNISMKISN